MDDRVVLLLLPGFVEADLGDMPFLSRLTSGGDRARHVPGFPGVPAVQQASLLTGRGPEEHGVFASMAFDPQSGSVAPWGRLAKPPLWELLYQERPQIASLVWMTHFDPGTTVAAGARVIQAPGMEHGWEIGIHPSWLRDRVFHRCGGCPHDLRTLPGSDHATTLWTVVSVVEAVRAVRPSFCAVRLPVLAAIKQTAGLLSNALADARWRLDEAIRHLAEGLTIAGEPELLWLVVTEYEVQATRRVAAPNQALLGHGLLALQPNGAIDFARSAAWCVCDHQVAHVYGSPSGGVAWEEVAGALRDLSGVAEVRDGGAVPGLSAGGHPAAALTVVAEPETTFSARWLEQTPRDGPVRSQIERLTCLADLTFDDVAQPERLPGSFGAPLNTDSSGGLLLSNHRGVFVEADSGDLDLAELVLRQFGV